MYTLNAKIMANALIKALPSDKFQKVMELLRLVLYNQEQNKNINEYKNLKKLELLFQEES